MGISRSIFFTNGCCRHRRREARYSSITMAHRIVLPNGDARKQAFCHLNLTYCGDTKSSVRRDVSFFENVYLMGKLTMKLFGSSLFGQAIKAAGVGAVLMLSVS